MSKFILHIVFLFASASTFATTDTTQLAREKYPLTDPRNPNCPCHKYQELADKEYALLTIAPKPEIKRITRNKVELQSFIPQQPQLIQTNNNIFVPEIVLPIHPIKETSLSESNSANRHKKNINISNKLKFRLYRLQKKLHSKTKYIDVNKCFLWH